MQIPYHMVVVLLNILMISIKNETRFYDFIGKEGRITDLDAAIQKALTGTECFPGSVLPLDEVEGLLWDTSASVSVSAGFLTVSIALESERIRFRAIQKVSGLGKRAQMVSVSFDNYGALVGFERWSKNNGLMSEALASLVKAARAFFDDEKLCSEYLAQVEQVPAVYDLVADTRPGNFKENLATISRLI